jgi:hypothetical protein
MCTRLLSVKCGWWRVVLAFERGPSKVPRQVPRYSRRDLLLFIRRTLVMDSLKGNAYEVKRRSAAVEMVDLLLKLEGS